MIIFKSNSAIECGNFKDYFEASKIRDLFHSSKVEFTAEKPYSYSLVGTTKKFEQRISILVKYLNQQYYLFKEVKELRKSVRKLSLDSSVRDIVAQGYRPYRVQAKVKIGALLRDNDSLSSSDIADNISNLTLSRLISDIEVSPIDINSRSEIDEQLLNTEPYSEIDTEASCNDILEAIDALESAERK